MDKNEYSKHNLIMVLVIQERKLLNFIPYKVISVLEEECLPLQEFPSSALEQNVLSQRHPPDIKQG